MQRYKYVRTHYGIISGLFLSGYAFMRFFVEYTRQPDEHIGFLIAHLSMGQLLRIPMFLVTFSSYFMH